MGNLHVCIAKTLLPIFDRCAEFSAQLVEQGFSCMRVIEDYFDGFANSPEELALSRKIRAERARMSFWDNCLLSERGSSLAVLATPSPFNGNWYWALVKAKEEEFLRCGPSEELRSLMFEGEAERSRLFDIDPCSAREAAWLRRSWENGRQWHVEIPAQQIRCLDRCVASGIVPIRDVPDNPDDILDFVAECMLDALRDSSFRRVRAGNKRVILAKRISDEMELRFLVSAFDWSFTRFSKHYFGPDQEPHIGANLLQIGLGLHIRGKESQRFGNRPDVEIPFWFLTQRQPYERYMNAGHIAVAIGGWCALYRMIAVEVEHACLSCCHQND